MKIFKAMFVNHKKRPHSPTLVTEELEFSSSDKEIEEKVKKIMDSKKVGNHCTSTNFR